MGVNKLRPQIQLSLREYIDVWSGIAFEHYQQAVTRCSWTRSKPPVSRWNMARRSLSLPHSASNSSRN